MNKTLLLILCDFLLLNLLALTRWEKAEPARAKQPPVPQMAANAATKDQDLVEAMKLSLADERATREQLTQKLSTTESTLAQREQNVTQLQADQTKLTAALNATRNTAAELTQKVAAATQDATMTKEELARIQQELDAKRTEAERQAQALAALTQQQAEAKQKIEGLSVAVKVAEQEKQLLRESAETLKTQVEAERQDRLKAQAATTQLAQGVGQLAEKSGELTKEIRDNRPINANVLFSDYLANRVTAQFTAVRAGVFGPATREKATSTVLVTDGDKIYALLHLDDTPFPLSENSLDWEKVAAELTKPPAYHSRVPALQFLSLDPRVLVLPVDPAQATALGVKVYPIALEPFKFPEAVLVNGGGKGYGEVGFKLDASQPGYVRVDNRFFKRLFGDFAPSRGDLVLSKTGELLGIMVNSDYCALVTNFLPAKVLVTGDDVKAQHTADLLNELAARVHQLPLKLQ
jgi:X-X-X-Leu-X-X-Gly heptad repeat protein